MNSNARYEYADSKTRLKQDLFQVTWLNSELTFKVMICFNDILIEDV